MTGAVRCELTLFAETKPVLMHDPGALGGGDGASRIGTAGVDDDFLGGERHTGQAALDIALLVQGQHHQRDGEFTH